MAFSASSISAVGILVLALVAVEAVKFSTNATSRSKLKKRQGKKKQKCFFGELFEER